MDYKRTVPKTVQSFSEDVGSNLLEEEFKSRSKSIYSEVVVC